MTNTLPKISFCVTITDTNEQHTGVAPNVVALVQQMQMNIALAEIIFGDTLEVQQTVDPLTDMLTVTSQWTKTGKSYMTMIASKIPAEATVH